MQGKLQKDGVILRFARDDAGRKWVWFDINLHMDGHSGLLLPHCENRRSPTAISFFV